MMRIFLTICIVFGGIAALAQLRMPALFGDGMVLQRDQPVPLWGWDKPGEVVNVQWQQHKLTAKTDKQGKWRLQLPAQPAGGPYQLLIQSKTGKLSFTDVMVGEVWLCSGQSNMEWLVRNTMDAAAEIASAQYPAIRHIKVTHAVHSMPQDDIETSGWQPATPGYVGDFSAVAYFFARKLYQELGVPIGLINSSWGGTHVETWTSREAFESSPEFASMIASLPLMHVDSLRQAREKAFNQKMELWKKELSTTTEQETWTQKRLEDSQWKTLRVPGYWERQSLSGLDGTVWYRFHFTLNAAQAGGTAKLYLGKVDDNDITWMNGVQVGSTTGYNANRQYEVPAGVLEAGDNVLVVKVEDSQGDGGPYGATDNFYLQTAAGNVMLAGNWKYRIGAISNTSAVAAMGPNDYPTLLFNAMLHPLIPYGVKGAIWYQGESNAGRAFQYRQAFPLMINDWRKRWGQPEFPFYFVQLATFDASRGGNTNGGNEWAELREAQTRTLSLPATGMAVTTDIGNPADIHPRNKQEVGRRLAMQALAKTYGQQLVADGPILQKAITHGNKMILSFTATGTELVAKDKYGYLRGFEVAGSDRQWHFAKAFIENGKVVVWAEFVSQPVAVRYGWTDDASEINLFNREGLPAGPFRTDDWPRTTETKKFMSN